MRPNKLKSKLSKGELATGSWLSLNSTNVAEVMAQAGCDFLTIDLEHGPSDMHQTQEIIRVVELSGVVPLVRLSTNSSVQIKRVMDSGAYGVIVPMVNSAAQAQSAVEAVYYGPKGSRSVGLSRAQGYGDQFGAYRNWLKENAVVIVQIESAEAVKNIEEILAVRGLDAVMIGTYDLSTSLGVSGQLTHPLVLEAEQRILIESKKMNIPAGIHVVHPQIEEVKKKKSDGYRLIAYGADMIFLSQMAKQCFLHLK